LGFLLVQLTRFGLLVDTIATFVEGHTQELRLAVLRARKRRKLDDQGEFATGGVAQDQEVQDADPQDEPDDRVRPRASSVADFGRGLASDEADLPVTQELSALLAQILQTPISKKPPQESLNPPNPPPT